MANKDDLDFLVGLNTDDDEMIEKLSERYPVLDESAIKRIAASCEEKMDMRKIEYNDNNENRENTGVFEEGISVSGVDVIKKTPWYKSRIFAAAAALVITAGAVGAAAYGIGYSGNKGSSSNKQLAATDTTQDSTETESSPVIPVTESLDEELEWDGDPSIEGIYDRTLGEWVSYSDEEVPKVIYKLTLGDGTYQLYSVATDSIISEGTVRTWIGQGPGMNFGLYEEGSEEMYDSFVVDTLKSTSCIIFEKHEYMFGKPGAPFSEIGDDLVGIWKRHDDSYGASYVVFRYPNSYEKYDVNRERIEKGSVIKVEEEGIGFYDYSISASRTICDGIELLSDSELRFGVNDYSNYTRVSKDTDVEKYFSELGDVEYQTPDEGEYYGKSTQLLHYLNYIDRINCLEVEFQPNMTCEENGHTYTAVTSIGFDGIEDMKEEVGKYLTENMINTHYSELYEGAAPHYIEKDGVIYGMSDQEFPSGGYYWNACEGQTITFVARDNFIINDYNGDETGFFWQRISVVRCDDGEWKIDSITVDPADVDIDD